MNLRFVRLALTAILLCGLLSSCESFGKNSSRQALLDHHLKLNALDEAGNSVGQQGNGTSTGQIVAHTDENPSSTRHEIILPLGDPQPMVDEIGLAPDGSSKPFAADPADEVGLFPED